MNSLEIIRSLKAKTTADLATAAALKKLACAKRDALIAPFQQTIQELGHLIKIGSNPLEDPVTLASSMRITTSCHNHDATFDIQDNFTSIVGGCLNGIKPSAGFHVWVTNNMGHRSPRDSFAQKSLDHLLQHIATHYEEPTA